MTRRWFYCQPCEHKHWWQHRNPNVLAQYLGMAVMAFGVLLTLMGLRGLGVL